MILICAFNANTTRPLSYRKYKTTYQALRALQLILLQGTADYISVRIVKEELCPNS